MAPNTVFLLNRYLNAINLQQGDKWKYKRDACFEALRIADNVISNKSWSRIAEGHMIKGEVDTLKVRATYNKLALACDSTEVMSIFKAILIGEFSDGTGVNMGVIVDMRNAVRKELGFGEGLDEDKRTAFFIRIPGEKE